LWVSVVGFVHFGVDAWAIEKEILLMFKLSRVEKGVHATYKIVGNIYVFVKRALPDCYSS
jgi:hypothetical protein